MPPHPAHPCTSVVKCSLVFLCLVCGSLPPSKPLKHFSSICSRASPNLTVSPFLKEYHAHWWHQLLIYATTFHVCLDVHSAASLRVLLGNVRFCAPSQTREGGSMSVPRILVTSCLLWRGGYNLVELGSTRTRLVGRARTVKLSRTKRSQED